jgi:hypothetical protein
MLMHSFSCQHREHHITKRNYEISVVQEVYIARSEQQSWCLDFVIFFSKVYLWNLALRFG